jgi:hypothetical protein
MSGAKGQATHRSRGTEGRGPAMTKRPRAKTQTRFDVLLNNATVVALYVVVLSTVWAFALEAIRR